MVTIGVPGLIIILALLGFVLLVALFIVYIITSSSKSSYTQKRT